MIVDDIVNYINSKGSFETPREIIESALWYQISCLVGLTRKEIIYENNAISINFLAVTLAGSGQGKSFSLKEIKKLFDIPDEKYYAAILESYKEMNPEGVKVLDDVELSNYIPKSMDINIEGTTQGLYMRCLALSYSERGSINILNEEILDIIMQSNLNVIKELSDGTYNATVTKQDINDNITGIFANMLIFGSPLSIKRDKKTYASFIRDFGTGINRRSFTFYKEPSPIIINKDKKYVEAPDISNVNDFIRKELSTTKTHIPNYFEIDSSAMEVIELYKHDLIEFSNENLDDEIFSAELGSLDKIIKLSSLYAILHGKESIDVESLEYSWGFYLRCRNTVPMLFNTEPQHLRFYKIIKKNKNITKSEIFEKDIFEQKTFIDDMEMTKELAYRNNEILRETGSKIKKYLIEPLPQTKLDKLIVSASREGRGAKSVIFVNYEIPLNDGDMSLEKLCLSETMDAFCFCHFDGNRAIKNATEGQNIIAFDIDGGLSLDDAKEIFKEYTYIIYTTKSHTEENNRFRVVIPTKHTFYIDNEKHKEMISNVAETLDIPIYDQSTREQPRLWFPNPKGVLHTNYIDNLLDVLPHIPDTILNEKIMTNLESINMDEVDARISGILRWFYRSTYNSNRNNNLFRLGKFVKDLGMNYEDILVEANSNLAEPKGEREMTKIIRSVGN